ncbi:right-handed parallel beta-helix repeat-containing protein [Bacillus solimangrovi]|uniref:Right handed beta helix domain-containing protein n=1 Tax=Bacillus solimangrovi TaxID=1305675 RepID=A0A1E5LDA4_9BACI|nr:right-handed parallel beta-helix repeat-containing protein [Bacillus solimangrovi]OEH92040.1 hypothetical protein BFG57_17120 [Bacillus solimangrovi]
MTIHVVPTEFANVQAAIDAAVAGDSIQILAGTFDGFNVNKERLKVFGCGIGKTIIAGAPAMGGDDGIVVSADQTILKGFTVQGFKEEFDSDGVEVNSNNNILVNIESKFNSDEGFEIDGENNLIINCIASFNGTEGFDLDTEHHCIINCNSSQNGDQGFEITGDFNKVINNTGEKNATIGFEIGVNIFNTLFGNKSIKNKGNGIELSPESSNNNIIDNFICNNEGNGITLLVEDDFVSIQNVIDSNIVRNNGIDDTTAGILVEDGSLENVIRFNKAKNNIVVDIEAEGGIGTNTYDGNKCENSLPDGLCT